MNPRVPSGPRIFIAYRRSDTQLWARAIYERLSKRFGTTRVFRDIDGLAPGRNFLLQLESQLSTCGYVLALIGNRWLTATNDQGQRRIDDRKDVLRMELATALQREVPVVPVLVDGASLPFSDELPDDLRELCQKQAFRLGDEDFDERMDRLSNDIASTLADHSLKPVSIVAPALRGNSILRLIVLSGAAAAIIGAMLTSWSHRKMPLAAPAAGTVVPLPHTNELPSSVQRGSESPIVFSELSAPTGNPRLASVPPRAGLAPRPRPVPSHHQRPVSLDAGKSNNGYDYSDIAYDPTPMQKK